LSRRPQKVGKKGLAPAAGKGLRPTGFALALAQHDWRPFATGLVLRFLKSEALQQRAGRHVALTVSCTATGDESARRQAISFFAYFLVVTRK